MRACSITAVFVALLACACSSSTADPPGAITDADGATVADSAGPPEPVSCENACRRAPRCEAALVTEADCLALCNKAEDSYEYACCLQYAKNCDRVRACLDGTDLTCAPAEGAAPWIELALLDRCECGEGDTPKTAECKETGPDHPCPVGSVCLKPVNDETWPFCAVECTMNAGACEAPLGCETTPKTWYCAP